MDKKIYYFTGTGNSLAVARDIADLIKAELISIPWGIKNNEIENRGEIIGFVFPIYHQDIPLIVKRFLEKMNNLESRYIFAICTYGDSPGICLKKFKDLIIKNGGKLHAGFAVRMPYNYINPSLNIFNFYNSFTLREVSKAKKEQMFIDFKLRQKEITNIILNRKEIKIEIKSEFIETLVDKLNLNNTLKKYVWLKVAGYHDQEELSFQSAIRYMDYGFKTDDKCNSCGICEKVCPVDNIEIKDGKPSWSHGCEQCFACLQWCPETAIQYKEGTKNQERYHHPQVFLSDII